MKGINDRLLAFGRWWNVQPGEKRQLIALAILTLPPLFFIALGFAFHLPTDFGGWAGLACWGAVFVFRAYVEGLLGRRPKDD